MDEYNDLIWSHKTLMQEETLTKHQISNFTLNLVKIQQGGIIKSVDSGASPSYILGLPLSSFASLIKLLNLAVHSFFMYNSNKHSGNKKIITMKD